MGNRQSNSNARVEEVKDAITLRDSRLLKTLHVQNKGVVKIYYKQQGEFVNVEKMVELTRSLLALPNCLVMQITETEKIVAGTRDYIAYSLYDSTRPFLASIEKQFIVYQLLTALTQIHERSRYQYFSINTSGDLRTENILVTTWNWVYLVDFATYKPINLPDDNPTDFSLFFDSSSRRSCYIAPERFYKDHVSQNNITAAMDIFSLGCTIAELFLDGTPLFTLSQLLGYRAGLYSPKQSLDKIEDVNIRDMIESMISLDPSDRSSAEQYLVHYKLPEVFYTLIYNYFAQVSDKASCFLDSDSRIERLYNDFATISACLGITLDSSEDILSDLLPVNLNIAGFTGPCTNIKRASIVSGDQDPSLIFILLICTNIRNCLFPSTKIKGIDMLVALGAHLEDDYKMDRIVPYLVSLVEDSSPSVRSSSLIALTQILALVTTLTPLDANIFTEYILPAIRPFTVDQSVLCRSTFAQCISQLAQTGLVFLDMSEVLRSNPESDFEGYYLTYESALKDLQDIIQDQVVLILTDTHASVKKAVLVEMTSLCIFFGRQKANDFLISHIITYLNDSDWTLRASFCEAIVGVGTFVGTQALDQFILPLLIMALTDNEEMVVERVLNSLTSLCELGLIQKTKLKDLVALIVPLLIHPNVALQYGSIGFIASSAKILPPLDVSSVIIPLVKPFLKNTNSCILTDQGLVGNVQECLGRKAFDLCVLQYNNKTSQIAGTITSEDREKSLKLSFYISKASEGRTKVKEERRGGIALREFNVIPHTVFLQPPDIPDLAGSYDIDTSLADSIQRVSPKKVPKSSSLGNISAPSSRDRLSGISVFSNKSKLVLDGQERHLQGLLEKKRLELTRPLLTELGSKGKRLSPKDKEDSFVPSGRLIAHFSDHSGCVNDLLLSPDHMFFASCSDDSTVKIWDTQRLFTNVTNRPRLTYTGHDSPVKAISFIEGRHSVATASVKGQIHVSRVEYMKSGSITKYGNYNPVTAISLLNDYASHLSHHDTDNASLLVYGTRKGVMTAIDLRSMKEAWSFVTPAHYGKLTAMTTDRNHNWIMSGTHRGVVSLWDTRFSLCLKAWQHPTQNCITKLDHYPQGVKTICMSVENRAKEVSIWDVESAHCHELWCTLDNSDDAFIDTLYSDGVQALDAPRSNIMIEEKAKNSNAYSLPKRAGKQTFAIHPSKKFIVAGGSERRLRYLDIQKPSKSLVFSGLSSTTQPVFNSHPFRSTHFHIEHIPSYSTPRKASMDALDFSLNAKTHLDSITAIAIAQRPQNLVITASRDGAIKVFQ